MKIRCLRELYGPCQPMVAAGGLNDTTPAMKKIHTPKNEGNTPTISKSSRLYVPVDLRLSLVPRPPQVLRPERLLVGRVPGVLQHVGVLLFRLGKQLVLHLKTRKKIITRGTWRKSCVATGRWQLLSLTWLVTARRGKRVV